MENAMIEGKPDTLREAMRRADVIGASVTKEAMPNSITILASTIGTLNKQIDDVQNRLNKREEERATLSRLIDEDYATLSALRDMVDRAQSVVQPNTLVGAPVSVGNSYGHSNSKY